MRLSKTELSCPCGEKHTLLNVPPDAAALLGKLWTKVHMEHSKRPVGRRVKFLRPQVRADWKFLEYD